MYNRIRKYVQDNPDNSILIAITAVSTTFLVAALSVEWQSAPVRADVYGDLETKEIKVITVTQRNGNVSSMKFEAADS